MDNLNKVVLFLKKGGVAICPTDTVYGFLADAGNKKAVSKIYKIKKRPKSKPLSLFVSDLKMVKKLAEIDGRQEKIIKKKWPGKYTFVLKSKIKNKKLKLYGTDKNTIALRIPKHAFLQKLLKKFNGPIAQTSVNVSSQKPLNKISDIIKVFGESDIFIIDGGDIKKAKASKIIDLTKNKSNIIRR